MSDNLDEIYMSISDCQVELSEIEDKMEVNAASRVSLEIELAENSDTQSSLMLELDRCLVRINELEDELFEMEAFLDGP